MRMHDQKSPGQTKYRLIHSNNLSDEDMPPRLSVRSYRLNYGRSIGRRYIHRFGIARSVFHELEDRGFVSGSTRHVPPYPRPCPSLSLNKSLPARK